MLTTMTQEDWTIVLQVFAASRSRRGDKGRDDRKFLEALHYFVVHNITWRAFPAQIRPLEQRLEAVLAIEPRRHLRSLLRCACGDERDGASRSDVRFPRGARQCLGGEAERGLAGRGRAHARGAVCPDTHLEA